MGVFLAAIPHAVRFAVGAGKTYTTGGALAIGATGAATQVAPSGVKFNLPELKGAGRVNEPHFSQTPQKAALHANSGRGNALLSGELFSWGGKNKSTSDSGGNQPGGPVGDPGGQGPKWLVPVLGTALTASFIDNVLLRTTGKGAIGNAREAVRGVLHQYENTMRVDHQLFLKDDGERRRYKLPDNTKIIIESGGQIASRNVYLPKGSALEVRDGGIIGMVRTYTAPGALYVDGGKAEVNGRTRSITNNGGKVRVGSEASIEVFNNISGSAVVHASPGRVTSRGGEVIVRGNVNGAMDDRPYGVFNEGNGDITVHGEVRGRVEHSGTGTTTLRGLVKPDYSTWLTIVNSNAEGGKVIVYGDVRGAILGPVTFMRGSSHNGFVFNKETQIN